MLVSRVTELDLMVDIGGWWTGGGQLILVPSRWWWRIYWFLGTGNSGGRHQAGAIAMMVVEVGTGGAGGLLDIKTAVWIEHSNGGGGIVMIRDGQNSF